MESVILAYQRQLFRPHFVRSAACQKQKKKKKVGFSAQRSKKPEIDVDRVMLSRGARFRFGDFLVDIL